MRQIYYSIRTLLHERTLNIVRVLSLSLGLTVGILLFSQIAFEMSYEKCYPEAENLIMARIAAQNMTTGEVQGDDGMNYDYTVCDPVAFTLAQDMPEEIESATCGQQQRVAIARAVVTNPKLILADEPTGNLDSKNGAEVMNLLTELNKEGTTIIMVTHSQHDASFAHRTVHLFDGSLVASVIA